jgi:hypothetical protein
MKIQKKEIRLSPNHPSLLLNLTLQKLEFGQPLTMNREGILVDGYRRYQLHEEPEIEVHEIQTNEVFPPALELNRHSRAWDEADCILWIRWARSLGIDNPPVPIQRFQPELLDASEELYRWIAQRKLTVRQVHLLHKAPPRYRSLFTELLTEQVDLNDNETRDLIEMASDLANSSPEKDLKAMFQKMFSEVLADKSLTASQKGEILLREVRVLRYPYYHKALSEFTGNWKELHLEPDFQAKKDRLVKHGILELTFSATSLEDLKEKVRKLQQSLGSYLWNKVWK